MSTLSEKTLAQELDTVIKGANLSPLFQPIVDGSNFTIFGYEALIRGPEDSPLRSPVELFKCASDSGRLAELDFLCRKICIERYSELMLPGKLFLNIMPTSMLEPDFRDGLTTEFLAAAGLSPERVIIELTEHVPIDDYDLMREALDHYRNMGLQVALDDLGAKYSNLRQWVELKPEFVKIDRHFIQNIDHDPSKRQFIASFMDIARVVGCTIIAEGIETEGEYRCLRELHCDLMQGYYFARPTQTPAQKLNPDRPLQLSEPADQGHRALGTTSEIICRQVSPIKAKASVCELLRRFEADIHLRCIAVVNEREHPVGIVRQRELLGRFVNPFSHALYSRKAVVELMDEHPLIVERSTPIQKLSGFVTESVDGNYEDFVIVNESGEYLGVGNIVDLLREITSLQVDHARQANPLTGLPGNRTINKTLSEKLEAEDIFCATYCDLDNFKAYNDVYGYAQGDQIILALSNLLRESCLGADFVGHIGGDDFILLLEGSDTRAEHTCREILNRFAQIAPSFYKEEDRRAGGIRTFDRRGNEVYFPLISISLAVHPVRPGSSRNSLAIADVLTELKTQAKKEPGNSLFIDRRI